MLKLSLEGTPYEVIYPTSGTLRELKLGAEHLSGDFPYRNFSLVDQKAVENAAIAMQNASRNMHGCISSTHKKTIDCLSSLEPHVLVTEKRVLNIPLIKRIHPLRHTVDLSLLLLLSVCLAFLANFGRSRLLNTLYFLKS